MARIAGVNLPREKRLEVALTYIYGIGPSTAHKIAAELELSVDEKVLYLTDEEITKLRTYIDSNLEVEGELRRDGLPVNGQRTKTNARTRKGPKKTVGRGKKAKT
ncbi:MAG: 30S ribosomal protein S13 [Actinobacteria bacterium]|nr:MAG: 30S ribosomal protein S13 [Actinomycetota bacterium]